MAGYNLFGRLRERMIDLKSGKAIFVGGGSILLWKYIENSDKIDRALFVDEITANARGYGREKEAMSFYSAIL